MSITQAIARSFTLLLFAALPVVAPIAGCGSGSSKVGTTGTSATTRSTAKGRATFTFLWPKRTMGRLIPVDANSIQVKVIAADGTVAATQLIARPASGATSATVTYDNLIVGTYTIIASAFPNADGSGNAQAQAQTSATILQGQTTPFTLTLASTITSLALTSSTTTLVTGQTVTLIPTATDAQGNLVLVSPSTLQWSSSASSVASVDANGVVSAVSPGSATIAVTETESGKSVSVSFAVTNVASTPLPKATAYQINASHSGSISFGLPLNFPASPTWSVTLGQSMSYPIIADGRVFVTVANPQQNNDNTSGNYGTELYALDERTGRTVWGPITLTGTFFSEGLTYENGKLFVLNWDGVLRSFDAATGVAGWVTHLSGLYGYNTTPTAGGGIIYTVGTGGGGGFYAVDETNGSVLWTDSIEADTCGTPTVSFDPSGNTVGIYNSYTCQVFGFNPKTGALLWPYYGICESGNGFTSAYANGLLYVREQGGSMYQTGTIHNALTGAITGTFPSENNDPIPALNKTTGFFLNKGTLQGIDLASKNVLWSFVGDGNLKSAPIVIDQTVIVGSGSGMVYALNAVTGAKIWSGNAGGAIASPDEVGVQKPLNGLGAGEGYLVVPAGSQLTAWHIAGQ